LLTTVTVTLLQFGLFHHPVFEIKEEEKEEEDEEG
jgi:hypothetical protein